MLGNYFYHQIVRKTVIAFGTLFNDIHVQHDDGAGNVISDIKVPIAYGPRQKFLARITQQAELNKATQITLPRMSFEITNISYDSTRKAGITQTFNVLIQASPPRARYRQRVRLSLEALKVPPQAIGPNCISCLNGKTTF